MTTHFEIDDIIAHPRPRVFQLFFEELDALSEHLPNIDVITCEERAPEAPGVTRLVNRWRASKSEVPVLLRPFVRPHMLEWLDHALWTHDAWRVDWRVEPSFLTDAVEARGVNRFEAPSAGETRVLISGTIDVDPARVPGVPRFLARRLKGAAERFVVSNLEPNLLAVNRAVEDALTRELEAG